MKITVYSRKHTKRMYLIYPLSLHGVAFEPRLQRQKAIKMIPKIYRTILFSEPINFLLYQEELNAANEQEAAGGMVIFPQPPQPYYI